jgi:hypothetical protein
MARPVGLADRDFSGEAAALSPWLLASVLQVLVSRSCNKVARSYGGSIGEGMVSSPFAHCDHTNKHCADDTAAMVAHGRGEELGQTYSGEMQCQNTWRQDYKL